MSLALTTPFNFLISSAMEGYYYVTFTDSQNKQHIVAYNLQTGDGTGISTINNKVPAQVSATIINNRFMVNSPVGVGYILKVFNMRGKLLAIRDCSKGGMTLLDNARLGDGMLLAVIKYGTVTKTFKLLQF